MPSARRLVDGSQQRWWRCFVVVFGCILLSARGAVAQPSAEKEVRAAIVGYTANVQAFPHYKCQYELRYGTARGDEVGRSDRWTAVTSYKINFVVDGEFELLDLQGLPPPKPPPAKADKRNPSGLTYTEVRGFVSQKFIRSDAGSGRLTSGFDAINLLRSAAADTGTDVATPMDMGVVGHRGLRGPDRFLARPAEYVPTFLGRQVVDGKPLVGVRFRDVSRDLTEEFWFDPARGFLIARNVQQVGHNPPGVVTLAEAKEFAPGRWFPMRVIAAGSPANATVTGPACEIRVLSLDVENRPKPEELAMAVPAGTQVLIMDERGFFTLKQPERISGRDIPELIDKVERVRQTPRMDTGLTHRSGSARYWLWAAGGAGIILIAVGGWLWLRRRRRGDSARPA